jgi:hypothetical protein
MGEIVCWLYTPTIAQYRAIFEGPYTVVYSIILAIQGGVRYVTASVQLILLPMLDAVAIETLHMSSLLPQCSHTSSRESSLVKA